jgi:hypothetical protein
MRRENAMPKKIGKPLVKTEEEKAADLKLIEELENDPKNPSGGFDPLESQGMSLPNSIKGSDGDKSHVVPVGGEVESSDIEEEDEEFDSEDDPDTLTA